MFDHAENVNPDFINTISEENLYFCQLMQM